MKVDRHQRVLLDIQTVLESQHRLLDALLLEAVREGSAFDQEVYLAFREVLTRHIAIEEKVLLRALREAGVEFSQAARIHEDHRLISRLLAAEPTMATATELAKLLHEHEAVEESEIGLFATCAQLLDPDILEKSRGEYVATTGDAAWSPSTREQAFALVAGRKR